AGAQAGELRKAAAAGTSQQPAPQHVAAEAGEEGEAAAPRRLEWVEFIRRFPQHERLLSASFVATPQRHVVEQFIDAMLDACRQYAPKWMTIPQWPHADDASHNKINRLLAEASGRWRQRTGFRGRLILPAIFRSKAQ